MRRHREGVSQALGVDARILCITSEKLRHDSVFMTKYEGKFDTVLFSPPYFRQELYEAVDGQSV